MSNTWEVITAISTASTAVIALLTYSLVRWQWNLNKPTLSYNVSADTQKSYSSLSFSIEGDGKEKWFVEKIVVKNNRHVSVAEKVSSTENKPVPGKWKNEISFHAQTSGGGVYFTAPSAGKAIFKIYTALKINPRKSVTHTVTVPMHKYEKP